MLPPEGPGHSPTSPPPQLEEMEPRLLEFEQDPPNWREQASNDALSSLSKMETKRQEVINGEEGGEAEQLMVRRKRADKILLLSLHPLPAQSCSPLSTPTCGC